tara:strand:- start:171 stop:419 length:249 start_codon:yes stop_codon:yes gene_type:complete
LTLDSNIILSVIIVFSIFFLIVYELVKYFFQNTIKLWSNAYDNLKEKNELLKNEKENLMGQLDFQYESFQNEIQELKEKYKK